MFRFKLSTVAALGVAAILVVSVFGSAQAAPAADASNLSGQGSAPRSAMTPIEISMVAVPHKSKAGGPQLNVVIPGNCGIAFLYPSNGRGHVHYDFGYENLNNATFWVSAVIGAQNLDYGETDANTFSEVAFGSSWEKQGNLYTDTGENIVTASITAYGPFYDCVSSPGLTETVYVY